MENAAQNVMAAQAAPLLVLEDVAVHYGGVEAVAQVSLTVPQGQVVSIIGANGAGKTSLLKAIMGMVAKQGRVMFAGDDITHTATEALVGKGMALVPEDRALFAALSVADNLKLGAFVRYRQREHAAIGQDLAQVYELFPQLAERKTQLAGTMSGGEQQMLAMGRALMSKPRLLLLDEPSLGLAPLIVKDIFAVIGQLKQAGTTILLVEQNAKAALNLADVGYVMETGHVVLHGPAHELLHNPEVAGAYLGIAGASASGVSDIARVSREY